MIFFVISGYLVGGLTILKTQKREFDAARYFTARTVRIYVVLVPVLAIFGILDLLGWTWFDSSGLYTGRMHGELASLSNVPAYGLNFRTLAANLFSIQSLSAFPPLGTNGPLWSLAYEWWYYCLAGAALSAWTTTRTSSRLFASAALLLMVLLLPSDVLLWGTIWLLGAAVAIVGTRYRAGIPTSAALVLFAVVLALSRYSHTTDIDRLLSPFQKYLVDLAVGVAFGLLIWSTTTSKLLIKFQAINSRLADFSYSLYLVHFPLMIFVVALLYQTFGIQFSRQPDWIAYVYFIGLSFFIYAIAWQFANLFERRTPLVRRWLEQSILVTRPLKAK